MAANQNPHWLPHKAQYSFDRPHEIVILGRYKGKKGFVAMDDIQLWKGTCDQLPTESPPQPTARE